MSSSSELSPGINLFHVTCRDVFNPSGKTEFNRHGHLHFYLVEYSLDEAFNKVTTLFPGIKTAEFTAWRDKVKGSPLVIGDSKPLSINLVGNKGYSTFFREGRDEFLSRCAKNVVDEISEKIKKLKYMYKTYEDSGKFYNASKEQIVNSIAKALVWQDNMWKEYIRLESNALFHMER
jgi:hypothetical protein